MCGGKAAAVLQLDKQINLFAFGFIRLLVCIGLLSLISIEPGFQSFIFRRTVNDRLEQDIKLLTLRIIRRGIILDTIFPHHLVDLGFVLGIRVVDTDGISTVDIDQLHAGNVCIAVPNIDHIAERDTHLIRCKRIIYTGVIDIQNALFDTE